MEVYFFDKNMRYIGHRKLNEGESMPENATSEPVNVTDGQEAYLADGRWMVKDLPKEVPPDIV